MAAAQPSADPNGIASGLDVRTAIEISERGLFDRIAFAAIFAVISVAVLPWLTPVVWIASIAIWEWGIGPRLDSMIAKLPEERAATPYALLSLPGSALYQTLALLCLANGSALGVAIGVTWIAGAILNTFVYASASRQLLVATLAPTAVFAIIGPFMAYGLDWRAVIIPVLLGLSGLASQRFSLDHGAVLAQLADRQMAFADVERKLSVAIEASGDGLFELDLVADRMQVSANWLTMLGYEPGEFRGEVRGWRRFVHRDDLALLTETYLSHFQGGDTPYASTEIRMRCKDGGFKWVLSRAKLVSRTTDGAPWRVVGTTIDVSARKALEQQLEAARDAAEAANRSKSEFLANMSHEIRTPLNGVMGVASALRRSKLGARQAEMVSVIEDSAESLQVLLADILDLARVEAGRLEIAPEPFELRKTVVNIAELFRAKAEEKGLQLVVDVADDVEPYLLGDKVRIKQIVGNLLSNAVKFTDAGAVSLWVSAAAAEDGRRNLRFEVKDDGIGFDSGAHERLFGRFEQADGSITRRFGGAGLGLSISNALAGLMGGRITAQSEPGKGATFVLSLPLITAEAPGEAAGEQNGSVQARSGEDAAPLRILAAEDHEVNRKVLQLMFDGLSVHMTMAENGLEALERFAADRFDLILMDMQMPEMDGLQAIAAIRTKERDEGLARTPIIMLTANALPEHEAAGRAVGADAFVTKPVSAQALLETIDATLLHLTRAA
ncbi:MAG TPA: ATP-binding protein [Caulobacteraceae bacterium]|nr:ATP-binding protein [Caulobacteraceae bacterium]